MKKVVAVTFALAVLGAAAVPASAGTNTQLNISPQAQLWAFFPDVNGIAVTLTYMCSGGTGTISTTATQSAAQSNTGTPASAWDATSVKCDGTSKKVTQTLGANGFNRGTATVSSTLTAPSGTATDTKVVQVGAP